MDPEPVAETSAAAGWYEDRAPPVGQPQGVAAGSGEHELIGVLADNGGRQPDGQEPGQRNGAGLTARARPKARPERRAANLRVPPRR